MVCGLFYMYLTLNKFSLCPLNELVVFFFTSDPIFVSNVASVVLLLIYILVPFHLLSNQTDSRV
jgi:hypothetical protein